MPVYWMRWSWQLVPVLLGQCRRLFEDMAPDQIELELIRALDGPDVQHLCCRRAEEMALIRLYTTVSLDGRVTGPQDGVDAPIARDP